MTQEQMQAQAYKETDKLLAKLEKEILAEFKKRQTEVLEVVKTNYAKYLTGVADGDYYTTLAQYNRLKTMQKEFKGIYLSLNSNIKKTMLKGQYAIYDEAFYRSEFATLYFSDKNINKINFASPYSQVREASVTGDISVMQGIRDKKLKKQVAKAFSGSGETLTGLLTSNNSGSLSKIIKTVKSGLINGTSYAKQAQAIKKVVGNNAYNALRIARTEGNRNANAGVHQASEQLKEKGIDIVRQWTATLDDRTRSDHQELDGQKEDKDGLFHIHGLSARYPGDFGDPAEDINCRCAVINLVNGTSPQLRRGKDPTTGVSDIASYSTYSAWLQKGKK